MSTSTVVQWHKSRHSRHKPYLPSLILTQAGASGNCFHIHFYAKALGWNDDIPFCVVVESTRVAKCEYERLKNWNKCIVNIEMGHASKRANKYHNHSHLQAYNEHHWHSATVSRFTLWISWHILHSTQCIAIVLNKALWIYVQLFGGREINSI